MSVRSGVRLHGILAALLAVVSATSPLARGIVLPPAQAAGAEVRQSAQPMSAEGSEARRAARTVTASLAGVDRGSRTTPTWPLVTFSGIPEDPVAHDQPVLVTWAESRAGGDVRARTLVTERAPFANGACSRFEPVAVVPAPPSRVAAAGLLESGQCYRWTIHMVMDDATTNDQVSPPLWVAAPPPPFYRLDLYSDGAWSPQQTWTWCTAASVQMMVNMIRGTTDTSYATQLAIINFEHDHDRYPFAIAGSDPQGMVAALAQFGAGGYHWTRGSSADEVLRHAALALRITKKPSALFVAWGSHAWVMSGFTATADPLVTDDWQLTGVYVEGPLYPMQALKRGFYDPPPDQWYSLETMRSVVLPYWEMTAPTTSIWQGTYVVVSPDLG